MTQADILGAQAFHANGCHTDPPGPRGGRATSHVNVWRRAGATQTWKTRPGEFRIPVKFGLYGYGAITHENAHLFHVATECPAGLRTAG